MVPCNHLKLTYKPGNPWAKGLISGVLAKEWGNSTYTHSFCACLLNLKLVLVRRCSSSFAFSEFDDELMTQCDGMLVLANFWLKVQFLLTWVSTRCTELRCEFIAMKMSCLLSTAVLLLIALKSVLSFGKLANLPVKVQENLYWCTRKCTLHKCP